MWEGFSSGCRAGLTLKRYGQQVAFTIQSVGSAAAAVVWLVEVGVYQVRKLSREERHIIREEFKKLLDRGVIKPSNSPWAAQCGYVCSYVWSSHIAQSTDQRVRLPILLVVS